MYYTPQELYAGNKDGQPLDPALYDISMKFHFGGGKVCSNSANSFSGVRKLSILW